MASAALAHPLGTFFFARLSIETNGFSGTCPNSRNQIRCAPIPRHPLRRPSARMVPNHGCGEAGDQTFTPMRTHSPRTRRTKKSPNSASRSSCGRRGPKSVNFKSPPRAVFKSSAAARQACAPHTTIRTRSAFSPPQVPARGRPSSHACL